VPDGQVVIEIIATVRHTVSYPGQNSLALFAFQAQASSDCRQRAM
jgi:hypothetical protein